MFFTSKILGPDSHWRTNMKCCGVASMILVNPKHLLFHRFWLFYCNLSDFSADLGINLLIGITGTVGQSVGR